MGNLHALRIIKKKISTNTLTRGGALEPKLVDPSPLPLGNLSCCHINDKYSSLLGWYRRKLSKNSKTINVFTHFTTTFLCGWLYVVGLCEKW